MRVLVFGDSITQGYWDTEGGWVDKLRKYYSKLQVQDFSKDQPTVFNLGITADDSRHILTRAKAETGARTGYGTQPICIIQIGVNDSCTEPTLNRVPLEEYKSNLEKLIALLVPITHKVIFVGMAACDETRTTPVSWGEYYYTNKHIKAYEDQMKAVAKAASIPFVPVFDEFAKAMQNHELLADGLHPNNHGHEVIFEIVKPHLV